MVVDMKLDQKVDLIVSKIIASPDYELSQIIWMALKEQDRDTRHACAERINQVEIKTSLPEWDIALANMKSEFHNAVLNCREGIE